MELATQTIGKALEERLLNWAIDKGYASNIAWVNEVLEEEDRDAAWFSVTQTELRPEAKNFGGRNYAGKMLINCFVPSGTGSSLMYQVAKEITALYEEGVPYILSDIKMQYTVEEVLSEGPKQRDNYVFLPINVWYSGSQAEA